MKCFKYAITGVILFLTITASADSYLLPQDYRIKEAFRLHKKDPQSRMFLIAVTDTNDKDIGERCETDLDEVTYAFQELSDWIGMQWETPKIIKGDDFSKAAVNDVINNWLPSQQLDKSDIIIFYYSGHGFRYAGDASDYPRMWLKTTNDQNVETNNLRMEEDVYDNIIKLGAGINIILSDCCNTSTANDNGNFSSVAIPAPQRVEHKRQHPKDESNEDKENGDILFDQDHPFSILATAAEKDEYAGGKADVGGFFTDYFLEALSKCIYDGDVQPAWNNIFNYADENAGYWAKSAACPDAKHNEQGRCVQTVKFKIDD